MNKVLNSLGKSVLYVLTYILCQMISGILVVICLGLIYGGQIAQDYVSQHMKNITLIVTALAAVFTLLIVNFVHRKKERNLLSICCFNKVCLGGLILSALLAFGLSLMTGSFIQLTQHIFSDYAAHGEAIYESVKSLGGFVLLIIFLPIFEEILFRSVIIDELRQSMRIEAAVVIQSLMFALIHFNIAQGIYTFFLGIVLALVFIWTGSIWANITLHIVFNILGTFGFIYCGTVIRDHDILVGLAGLFVTSAVLTIFYKKAQKKSSKEAMAL